MYNFTFGFTFDYIFSMGWKISKLKPDSVFFSDLNPLRADILETLDLAEGRRSAPPPKNS